MTLYVINKQIREAHADVKSIRDELKDARSLCDPVLIRSLKRREQNALKLMHRNSKTYAELEFK